MKFKIINLLFVLFSIGFIACKNDGKKKGTDWTKIEKSVSKWENYKLKSGLEAPFPQRPVSKTTGFSQEVTFQENYTEKDSVTYSVNIIENKAIKDANGWQKFLNEEVLAFKALARSNVKVSGLNAVLSKVRENNLCGYSLNMIVDNRYILNVAVRKVGEFPTKKLLLDYAEKIKLAKNN